MSAQFFLPRLTLRQIHRLRSSNKLTMEKLCSYCYSLAVAGEDIWGLNAFHKLCSREEVMEAARASDERWAKGNPFSILDGIPISVKANIAVSSQPLTAGSRILGAQKIQQAPNIGYDADVVRAMGGAVLIGLTNMDEFGMGSLGTNVHSSIGRGSVPTKNPRPLIQKLSKRPLTEQDAVNMILQPETVVQSAHREVSREDPYHYSAGGSSCGSAASIAHGSTIVSLGTDTGGSVRLPAAWCGVTGLKPSYGLLSRHGLVSYASSLDTVGILTPSPECAGIVLDVLLRLESDRDSTMTRRPSNEFQIQHALTGASDENCLSHITVGIPAAFSVQECPSCIYKAWEQGAEALIKRGATVKEIGVEQLDPRVVQRSLAAYYVLVSAEASSNLSRYDGLRYGITADFSISHDGNSLSLLEKQYAANRTMGLGSEVVRRILCGTSVLSSDRFHTFYEAAARLRADISQQLHSTLQDVDLLLVPTAVSQPVSLDSHFIDQTAMFANDVMTVPLSLAGLPAISVPHGTWGESSSFRPGLQVVAGRHNEPDLLLAAAALYQATELEDKL